jgi:hypothetical protein
MRAGGSLSNPGWRTIFGFVSCKQWSTLFPLALAVLLTTDYSPLTTDYSLLTIYNSH